MKQRALALVVALGCVALALAAACGGPPDEDVASGVRMKMPDERDSLAVEEQESLVMPEYPEPVAGHLVTRSAVPEGFSDEIAGEWPARAGRCDEARTLQVVASREGTGAFLLFFLPSEDHDGSAYYPVVPVDSTVPEPPAVRIGVQHLETRRGESYRGYDGTVELAMRGQEVSGRFALPLRNVESPDTVLYAGVFDRVRVRRLTPEECRLREEPADTLAAPADSLD